jgi:uncharacterized protein
MDGLMRGQPRQKIAVIGAGITGLSCAWALSARHDVTLYEAAPRLGGHSHTVDAEGLPVDTGFIVYNEPAYPNLTALFAHLGVATQPSDMSFSVSLREGALEYAGTDLPGLFAQKRNLVSPRFWAMVHGLLRFDRAAPGADCGEMSLADFLRAGAYGEPFLQDHLYPMIAAIWSCPVTQAGDLPAAAFIRFCENHGLLKLSGRPIWRTVTGGSRQYVQKLRHAFLGDIRTSRPVVAVHRAPHQTEVQDITGQRLRYDQAILACHADTALRLLAEPDEAESRILGAFRFTANEAYLHNDASLMPRRRAAWASWNYTGNGAVTYWMNRLQDLPTSTNWFVTLNPAREPARVARRQTYEHPVFDLAAMRAQAEIWSLQGRRRTWFCGAWCGAGFHEDGLQAGLAVAEACGGVRRPWRVAGESARLRLPAGWVTA